MKSSDDYEDIPGTYVFNTHRCKNGYPLSQFCKFLDDIANRVVFKNDASGYLDRFALITEQRRCAEERDWLGVLQVGGNIYYTFKLAIVDGLTMQHVGGMMSQMTVDEFRQMMLSGGRPLEGNTSKKENASNG